MKRKEFIKLIADTLGIEEKTVVVVSRSLREAGHITTGARGVNAPHMTARDAATVCLAFMAGGGGSNAVRLFEHYKDAEISDLHDRDWVTKSPILTKLELRFDATLLVTMQAFFLSFKDIRFYDEFINKHPLINVAPVVEFSINEKTTTATLKIDETGYGVDDGRHKFKADFVNNTDDAGYYMSMNNMNKAFSITRTLNLKAFKEIGTRLFEGVENE